MKNKMKLWRREARKLNAEARAEGNFAPQGRRNKTNFKINAALSPLMTRMLSSVGLKPEAQV